MKKHIIFLLAAFLVFAGTLLVTNYYVTREMVSDTDEVNQLFINYEGQYMDALLYQQATVARNFLACVPVSEWQEKPYQTLEQLLTNNPWMSGAAVIFNPQFTPDHQPFAPAMDQGDTTHYNFAARYDYTRGEGYRHITETHRPFWHIPSRQSGVSDVLVTYLHPILTDDSTLVGALSLDFYLGALREQLTELLPYGEEDSEIRLVDEQGHMIISSRELEPRPDDCTYHTALTYAPWSLITTCRHAAIYHKVHVLRRIILVVALIGMLLMLGCCWVIFRYERHNLQLKAAAEEELQMAARVQTSMLKSQFPQGLQAFIRPAREAGGDLYDFVEREGKLIFCIGDVSGKGMPAALFMTQVVSLFRQAVRHTSAPATIVAHINDILSDNNPNMTFCTFFVGVLEGHTLTYCNAGHNAPVHIAQGAQAAFIHPHPNIALGLMANFPYREESLTLHSGDQLLLYTDGVTEAKNSSHSCFGDDRLLTASASIHQLLTAVAHFVGEEEQSDDITLLQITVK